MLINIIVEVEDNYTLESWKEMWGRLRDVDGRVLSITEVKPELTVSYTHPGNRSVRFNQYIKDKIPDWAVDILIETPDLTVEDFEELTRRNDERI